MPQPYYRTELRELRRTLARRWPLLEREYAAYWIDRWRRGISPYSRVRSHAIRLQVEAIIALALDCGLRRHEILALTEDWVHYDNLGVVVWQPPPGPWKGEVREVPYTDRVRTTMALARVSETDRTRSRLALAEPVGGGNDPTDLLRSPHGKRDSEFR